MLAYTSLWTAILIVVHTLVITLLSWQVYRHTSGWTRMLGFLILFPWLGATILITTQGVVEEMTAVFSPLGVIMTTSVITGLLLIFYWPPLKRIIRALPLSWLIGVQVYRVLGIVFLFGWLADELPSALGPITAFNDVFVGVTALVVARLIGQGRGLRIARFWNVFGLLDFVYAITVGVLAAPHALQLLPLTPDTAALGLLPLSFITLWAVPLSIFLHAASLMRLAALRKSSGDRARLTLASGSPSQ